MSFGFGKKDTEYSVIIDVHSGSVGIAIVYMPTSAKDPEIVFSYREFIKLVENPSTENLVRAIRNALFSAVLQFSQEGTRLLKEHNPYAGIGKTLLICGAPWAQTATRFIRVQDKEPFLITEDKISSLLRETEHRDEEELQTSAMLKELRMSLVEHAVVHTELNGYKVSNPYGKKAIELSLSHISGLVPKAILEAVKDIEDKLLLHVPRTTHTFALALFCVTRDLYPQHKHALIIDISGEATELCIIQDEVLLEAFIFPFGTHTFLREVAQRINTFPDEAWTHIKEETDTTAAPIRAAIQEVRELYATQILDACTTLSSRYIIPHHIFLITSKSMDTFFDPLIEKTLAKYIEPHGSFTSLNKTLGLPAPDGVLETKDVFFILEARFFHKIHMCGEIS